jgi:mono/diheme cytochrome c family protein
MLNFRIGAVFMAAGLLFTSAAFAIENEKRYGDPEHGRGLAVRWCGSCHLVTTDQQRAMPDAPPFTKIAQTTDISGDSLARLLESPHPRMAKLALSTSALDDIAAYIVSLKK